MHERTTGSDLIGILGSNSCANVPPWSAAFSTSAPHQEEGQHSGWRSLSIRAAERKKRLGHVWPSLSLVLSLF